MKKMKTPLAGVCFKGYLPMCELLVQYGANIDENNGFRGMTPYTFAILFGRKDVAEFLLKKSKRNFFKKIALNILKFIKNLFSKFFQIS